MGISPLISDNAARYSRQCCAITSILGVAGLGYWGKSVIDLGKVLDKSDY